MPHHGLDVVEPGRRATAPAASPATRRRWIDEIAEPGQAAGRRGRHRALRAGAGRGAVSRARARSRRAGARSMRSPRGSSRSSCCAGPGGSIPGFQGGGRQRAARAIEVALLTGHPLTHWQAGGARRGRDRAVVRCAHRAAAGAAPADRAPGGRDGAARADRGGGRRAGRGARAAMRRGSTASASGGGGVPARPPVRARRWREAISDQHPAVRQAAGDLVPPPARRPTCSRWTRRAARRELAAERSSNTGRHAAR